MTQLYSPSTRDNLLVFADDDPPIEEQCAWIQAHPDCVNVLIHSAAAAITSREQFVKAWKEHRV